MDGYYLFVLQLVVYLCCLVFSWKLINKSNPTEISYFDPAILLIAFVSLTFVPVSFLVLFGYQMLDINSWYSIIDLNLYSKTIGAHSVIIISFSVCYFFLSKFIHHKPIKPLPNLLNVPLLIVIILIARMVAIASSNIGGTGIIRYFSLFVSFIREPAEIILIGYLACRFNSKTRAIIFVIMITFLVYFLPQLLSPLTSLDINRGRIFATIIAALCFLNFQKWENKLLSRTLFFASSFFGVIALGGLVMIEGMISSGDTFSINDILINFAFGFEPILFDTAANIIKWIDSNKYPIRYGMTYLEALDGLNLFSVNFLPLSEWYVWEKNPEYAATGGRYNFSSVAEGYLNGRMLGVIFHGFILGFIAILIKSILYTRFLYPYNFVFYSSLILLVNTMNRKGMMGVLGTFEILLVGAFLLCFIHSFLESIFIKNDS